MNCFISSKFNVTYLILITSDSCRLVPTLLFTAYSLNSGTTIVKTRDDFSYSVTWTFESTINQRIRFHFTAYSCRSSNSGWCRVRVGNGLTAHQSMILDHTGTGQPGDVTTAANTAWLYVYDSVNPPINILSIIQNQLRQCAHLSSLKLKSMNVLFILIKTIWSAAYNIK